MTRQKYQSIYALFSHTKIVADIQQEKGVEEITIDEKLFVLPKKVEEGLKLTSSKMAGLGEDDFINSQLTKPVVHLLNQPGKMLRPTLVLLGADIIGEDPSEFVDMAVAAELLHVSSLVHDDIIDRDSYRRGAESVHAKYGEEAAILAGDALISKAIQLASSYGGELVSGMAKTAMNMCAGEILDSNFQLQKKIPDLDNYLKIAELKSADFIGTVCSLAAKYKKNEKEHMLYEFGKNIGIAFQIRDDVIEHVRLSIGIDKPRRMRLNIIDALSLENEQSALMKAIEINNAYVDRAWGAIAETDSVLKIYTSFVKLSKNYAQNKDRLTELASLQ